MAESLVYLGLTLLVYAIPTNHTNTFEGAGVIFVLIGCFVLKYIKNDWKFRLNPLHPPIFLLFTVILFSIFSCFDLSYTLNEIRGEFLTYIFLFYALAGFCAERERLYLVLAIFFLGNLLALFLFFYQFYDNDFIQLKFVRSLATKKLFSKGLTEVSSYFLIFSSLYYASLYFVSGKKYVLLTSILLICNIYMLYLSYQRAGIVAMAVVLLVPLMFYRQFSPKRIFYIMLPVMIALVFFVMVTPIKSKFMGRNWEPILSKHLDKFDQKDAIQVRFLLYEHFWQSFKQHPFVGYGYGRSNLKKVDKETVNSRPNSLTHGHNTFFNFTLQTGVQGLVALLFLLFVQFSVFFKGMRLSTSQFERFVFAGTLCLMCGFWARMLFDDVYDSGIALAYWMVMAMAVGLYLDVRKQKTFSD
ncbi:MAG: hypothetical protein BM485_07810 [Desulfobulbaceae bacterium DB1]|nr:MAG: hypothetical protein BM485_07810 [Desulfobulbaceae bacterium DB1]